jgi:phospholipase/carboxylesterase
MSPDRPDAHALSFDAVESEKSSLVEARFIPQRYEPNYPYPLLVLFHARGGDEQQMVRSMPALSWRNYVGLSLRGPETVARRDRPDGHGWGPEFARPDRRAALPAGVRLPEAEIVRRRLIESTPDPIDTLEDGVFAAIRQTRRALHVHSERIYLVGCGEGAAVAYRLGLTYPERFAGIVAINGWLPGGFRPLARVKECRDLRILVVHGEWNARVPVQSARRDVAVLRNAGIRVSFHAYPCAHRLTSPMLADVDTWLINHCTADL